MAERIIKGQAWIFQAIQETDELDLSGRKVVNVKVTKESLVQDKITFFTDGNYAEGTSVIVDDIWADLTKAGGQYKYNAAKNYFYWEYKMTSMEDDDTEITVRFDCPQPKEGLFKNEDGSVWTESQASNKGEYAKYWSKKMREAAENYEKAAAVQVKEVILKGSTYHVMDPTTGDDKTVTVNDITVKNANTGDLSNLLGFLF